MYNSAHILARIMISNPFGKEEVFQVLKDVHGLQLRLEQKDKALKTMNSKFLQESSGKTNTQQSSVNPKTSDKANTADRSCQTNDTVQENVFSNSKIEDLKVNIQEKISDKVSKVVKGKDSEIHKLHKKIADQDIKAKGLVKDIVQLKIELSAKCKEKTVIKADLEKYKKKADELIFKKPQNCANSDIVVKELEKRVTELYVELTTKGKEKTLLEQDFKKYKEYSYEMSTEKDEKISALNVKIKNLRKDIEKLESELSEKSKKKRILEFDFKKYKEDRDEIISGKNKRITNLNAELKDACKDVKELKNYKLTCDELISEKELKIKNLISDVEKLRGQLSNQSKDKTILEEDFKKYKEQSEKTISGKDNEISNLVLKAKKLSMDIEVFNEQLTRLEQDFISHKADSSKTISEKDKKIADFEAKARELDNDENLRAQLTLKCKENSLLKQDLKKYKELSDVIISKYKEKNEKIISETDQKLRSHREIYCVMKDSIISMATMQKDISDKIIDAVKNTSLTQNKAGNSVLCRFKELEEEVTRISQGENLVPKLSIKKDIFKQETVETPNSLEYVETKFGHHKSMSREAEGRSSLKRKFPD